MGQQAGLCGWVGDGSPEDVPRMLAAMAHRGTVQTVLGARDFSLGRASDVEGGDPPGSDPSSDDPCIGLCAGQMLFGDERVASPEILVDAGPDTLGALDGAFVAALWQPSSQGLVLCCDPFGIRTLFYAEQRNTLYFASELKALLALSRIPVEVDLEALHHYLSFSFVPGNATLVSGVRRMPPGHLARWHSGGLKLESYVRASAEAETLSLEDGTRAVLEGLRASVRRRLAGGERVGVYLSGGLDSSAVAWALREAGAEPVALSLSFGRKSVERREARLAAKHLGLKRRSVRVRGRALRARFMDVVHKLDLPYGDPVTAPQYLLAAEARRLGLAAVFNGEGGDQLFGGWSNEPMIAAALYGRADTRALLRTHHRFYALEARLYSPEFASALGESDTREELVRRLFEESRDSSFLHRLRCVDIGTRGARNLLPRAEAMAASAGLDVRMPLFDPRPGTDRFSRLPAPQAGGCAGEVRLEGGDAPV